MSLPKMARNVRSSGGNNGSGIDGGSAEFGRAVALAIKADFGLGPSAVKTVAAVTGANERAVKNWFQGRNAPSAYFLSMLTKHSVSVFRLLMVRAGRGDTLVAVEVGVARTALLRALEALDVGCGVEASAD
jgi:hypothetical protein